MAYGPQEKESIMVELRKDIEKSNRHGGKSEHDAERLHLQKQT